MTNQQMNHEAQRLLDAFAAAPNQRAQADYLYKMPPVMQRLLEQVQTLQAAVDEGWEWKGEAGRLKEQKEATDELLGWIVGECEAMEEYHTGFRWIRRRIQAVSSPAKCPDCKGMGATDTETGVPCQRPSSSCEECFTCDGTGEAPSPASEPEAS